MMLTVLLHVSIIVLLNGVFTGQALECNIAKHRKTEQSSTFISNRDPAGYSCNAVDGIIETEYHHGSCSHTNDGNSHFWKVDLEKVFTIIRLELYLRSDFDLFHRFKGIDITVDDVKCSSFQGPPPLNFKSPLVIRCAHGTTGRNLTISKQNTETLELCEVQVFALVDSCYCPEPAEKWTCGVRSYEPTMTTCDNPESDVTVTDKKETSTHAHNTTDVIAFSPKFTSQHEQETTMQIKISTTNTALVQTNEQNPMTYAQEAELSTRSIVLMITNSQTMTTNAQETEVPQTRSTELMNTNSQSPITNAQRSSTEIPVNPSAGTTDLIPSDSSITTNTALGSTLPRNKDECLCPCSSVGSTMPLNLTVAEILEKIADVINEIRIDKKKTKIAQNKLVCAKDDRPSSRSIGIFGLFFIILVVGTVILMDIHILVECLHNKKYGTNRGQESTA